jgi:hypothetical protein
MTHKQIIFECIKILPLAILAAGVWYVLTALFLLVA